ncbi:MAG: zinc carboxypeptidase [Calditrichaeota bacterium]|nr:MAG: zinc carboxypeptidase [Calditrichota bacterium]
MKGNNLRILHFNTSPKNRLLLFSLLFSVNSAFAHVTLDTYLPPDQVYNKNIPTPKSFLGFEVGEWHVRHDQLVGYLQNLAAASDRITLQEYGKTHELRSQIILTITAPRNHGKLKRLQKEHKSLLSGDKAREYDFDKMPGVVWLGYSVHGNEPSGSNAALLVAYHLAAAEGKEIDQLLRENIILLEPCLNPDGLSRFAHWVNMHRSKNPVADKYSREHREGWPRGRTNHYWFDLNRDWLPVQQPESKNRLKIFHEWAPNILTDHHEMGTNSTLFFQPGVPSRTHPLIPAETYELTGKMAEFHARALDKIGTLYYTRQNFDDFYFGKGSTYPDINGAVGVLFEQASSRGHVQESDNGLLSFPATIRNQFTVSLSSLQAAKAMRVDMLQHMRQFYINARELGKKDQASAHIFGARSDPALNYHFLEMLMRHEIEVYQVKKDVRIGAFEFQPGSAYLVPTEQPQYHVVSAIFQRNTTFRDSLFYDVSAWTMPLAFNIPHEEVHSNSKFKSIKGDKLKNLTFPQGMVAGSETNNFAYAFEWNDYYSPKLLNALMQADLKVRVATQTFESQVGDTLKKFDYGAIVIPVGLQSVPAEKVRNVLADLAKESGITIFPLSSGLSQNGIDMGSPSLKAVREPKILLLVGPGISSFGAGEIWHLLDARFDLPVTLVDIDQFSQIKLFKYNTLILANGFYSILDSFAVRKIDDWVDEGNTLVAIRGAASWAIQSNLASTQTKKPELTGKNETDNRRAYRLKSYDRGARTIGGAICAVKLDLSHPLCYGYTFDEMSVFRRGTMFMNAAKSPYATPVVYAENPLQSGYISKTNLDLLQNTAVVVAEKHGSGQIILFADNPNFRGFWYGTNKLFLNSLFFAPIIR